MIIAIDYDNTLTRHDVQAYVEKLIKNRHNVWILTARFDELHKHLHKENPTNEDLYEVAARLGIPRHKIIFTNMRAKWEYLKDTFNVAVLLDDNANELWQVSTYTCVIAVDSTEEGWEARMEEEIKSWST